MKKFATVEECFIACGLDPKALPEVSMLSEKHQKAIISHYKLIIVCQALNEGWTPDWTNSNESKYAPYFNLSSGSGAVYDGCSDWDSDSTVSSLLVLKSRELAEYVGKQFAKEYNDYLICN